VKYVRSPSGSCLQQQFQQRRQTACIGFFKAARFYKHQAINAEVITLKCITVRQKNTSVLKQTVQAATSELPRSHAHTHCVTAARKPMS